MATKLHWQILVSVEDMMEEEEEEDRRHFGTEETRLLAEGWKAGDRAGIQHLCPIQAPGSTD